MNKIKKILIRNKRIYSMLSEIKLYFKYKKNLRLSPTKIVEKEYKSVFKKNINLNNPKTFNEKLNWLKINWFDERAIICSDKIKVKEYVKQNGLEEILIKTYGIYDDVEDINFDQLPSRFVLKPNHDSGHTIIVNNSSYINRNKIKSKLKRWMNIDYSVLSGEWPYKYIDRKIICEELLTDNINNELLDYKFFCFNGEPKFIFFVSDRKSHAKSDFYTLNWELLDFRWIYERSGKEFPRPKNLDKMIEYSKILSKGFPFVRVDFYNIDGVIYFGELTFFHGGGLGWFSPTSIDDEMGKNIILPIQNDPWNILK